MTTVNINATDNSRFMGRAAGSTWANIWNGLEGQLYTPTDTNPNNVLIVETTKTASPWIFRTYLDFDLSAIAGSIVSATLNLRVLAADDTDPDTNIGDGNQLCITKGLQSSMPPVWATDWIPQNTEVTILGQSYNFTLGAYNAVSFNATGLTWLETQFGGTCQLCLRLERDINNDAPLAVQLHRIVAWAALKGTGYEPYLSINYAATATKDRIGSIRHIYRPGVYKSEITLGGLVAGIDYPDSYVPAGKLSDNYARQLDQTPKADTEVKAATTETAVQAPPPDITWVGGGSTAPNMPIPTRVMFEINKAVQADQAAGRTTNWPGLIWSEVIVNPAKRLWNNLFGG